MRSTPFNRLASAVWRDNPANVRPMLATLADPPLSGDGLIFEPKYDGIRALVEVEPAGRVRLWSRLGNQKTSQFPELVVELQKLARRLKVPVLLDGEIVALDERGKPMGFQRLQGRIHLTGRADVERVAERQPVAFYAFDVLREGDADLRTLPLLERRAALERLLKASTAGSTTLRISTVSIGDGHAIDEEARRRGWEGLIVKDAHSRYESGRRSQAWRKRKLTKRQEFVIGGWTEPRQTRQHFGALLLGVYDEGQLRYAGHTGSGFDEAELQRVSRRLRSLEIERTPFSVRPKTNEPAHWTKPSLVAEVKFTEWTDDGKLRHPIYMGLRDDVRPEDVKRERAVPAPPAAGDKTGRPKTPRQARGHPRSSKVSGLSSSKANDALLRQLEALEKEGRDGVLELPDGDYLKVTNLRKIFWPKLKITKGELLRYYVHVSRFLLPAVADRPLVMKRFPNGVEGPAFYQQRAREERPPAGVRIETLPRDIEPIDEPDARRLVGGSLTTLLYMTQIAAISQDPWFSRVQSPLDADYVALDLDPMDGVPFTQVLDVARWVRDELGRIGAPGVPKTSGASGLHIYVPLPPKTSYETGQLFCQIVATLVSAKHPKAATVERKVSARGRTVYVDYLQNIMGKTLATAYSARASDFAGVATPLTWDEIDEGVDPRDFTIRTVPARLREVGDLWAAIRTGKKLDLKKVLKRA